MHKGEKTNSFATPADPWDSLDDNSLVAELRSGHEEALTVLFKRYDSAVFRTARRILGDTGEAEEIVQLTFLEMYQHIAEFDPARGSFLAWLLTRAKFRSVNRRDHLNVERFYEWTELDDADNAPHRAGPGVGNVHRLEVDLFLKEFLRKLPRRQRNVLELTFFEGRTAEEIAGETNESVSVVRRLLYGGLRRLKSAGRKIVR